jgi:hypothetical protein
MTLKKHVHLHKGIRFSSKLEITNSLNHIKRIHFKSQKAPQFFLSIVSRMPSLSKAIEDEVQSFIKLMFPSFEAFRGSRDVTKAIIELEQGLGHVKEVNNSQDCYIQTSVHDQPKKTSICKNRCKNRNILCR